MNYLSEAATTGIITSLIASGIVGFISFTRKKMHDKRYQRNNGTYKAYQKYDDSSKEPTFILNIEAKKNILHVHGKDVKGNKPIEGDILFDRNIPNYGTGYYTHDDGWGFFQVQIKSDDVILAHMPYQTGGSEVHQAYVFRKVEPSIS